MTASNTTRFFWNAIGSAVLVVTIPASIFLSIFLYNTSTVKLHYAGAEVEIMRAKAEIMNESNTLSQINRELQQEVATLKRYDAQLQEAHNSNILDNSSQEQSSANNQQITERVRTQKNQLDQLTQRLLETENNLKTIQQNQNRSFQ